MADNLVSNSASGGPTFATALATWSGDSANFPGSFTVIISGSEGSWSVAQIVGGAGAVSAGVQRMTLASDDPAVTSLASIDGNITACDTGNVTVASSALPTGAATAAKQPALGTAGTASADVITVQGIASMTALKVDGSAVTQPVSDGGSSLTVDGTVAASQSGTWNVGTLTSITNVVHIDDNSGSLTVDGTVAVSGSVAVTNAGLTTLATAIYAEDTASANADPGMMILARRTGTPANTSGTDGDYEALQMAAGRLWVDASGVTLTVGSHAVTNAGTFAVQAAQSGTWNVTNISGTVSLPTGAATAAKQPALGTAGTASSDVITVQGIASMTALKVDGSAVTQPVSGTFWQATQPVSGTVTAQQSTASSLKATVTHIDSGGTDITDTTNHALKVNVVAGGAGDGAILDGASSSIKATVLDYTNSNPLAVRLTDTSGDYVGAGAGTQYTEDAAAAANPTGTVPILVRADTPATTVSADGDNIAQRGTNYGAAYVTLLDTGGSPVSVGGGTQYTEDAAAASDPIGTMMIGVRRDTLTTSEVSADGDNIAIKATNKGQLHVKLADTVTVDASGTTLTVASHAVTNAGTFATQAAQSGTWNITNVSGTVSLPTGAATAAKQPALGTAGTASADVITVQGIASMTALKVDGSAVTQPVSGTFWQATQPVSGTVAVTNAGITTLAGAVYAEDTASANADPGMMVLARRTATPANTSGTDGDYEAIQISAGRVWTSSVIDTALPAGTNAIGKLASNSGVTIGAVEIAAAQTLGTVTTVSTVTNLSQLGGAAIAMGTGARSAGTQRVTIATDDVVPASQSGTWNIGTVTTLTTCSTVTNVATIGTSVTPGTSAAHLGKAEDAAAASGDTGVFTLGVRNETLTAPTSADGDYSQFSVGSAGEVITQQAPLSAHVTGNATTTGTSTTSLVAAQGASTYFYCTAFTAVNTGSTASLITFQDGSGGTTLWYAIVPAGGGVVLSGGGKPLFKTSANTALYFIAASASTTIYLSATGFKSKV